MHLVAGLVLLVGAVLLIYFFARGGGGAGAGAGGTLAATTTSSAIDRVIKSVNWTGTGAIGLYVTAGLAFILQTAQRFVLEEPYVSTMRLFMGVLVLNAIIIGATTPKQPIMWGVGGGSAALVLVIGALYGLSMPKWPEEGLSGMVSGMRERIHWPSMPGWPWSAGETQELEKAAATGDAAAAGALDAAKRASIKLEGAVEGAADDAAAAVEAKL